MIKKITYFINQTKVFPKVISSISAEYKQIKLKHVMEDK